MTKNLYSLSDESLMEYVKKHDHQAFSILVERHSNKFYASSYRIVMNNQEAEDIVQEAFLKLWDKPEMWKNNKGAKFTSWFYKIVMNMSLDRYRKLKPLHYIHDDMDSFETPPEQYDKLQKDDEQKELDIALKNLPENQLLALNLCFYEEMTNKEAAETMNVSVKALESLLMRAKQGLKDQLIRQGIIKQEDRKGYVA